jgi:uncharacterized protein
MAKIFYINLLRLLVILFPVLLQANTMFTVQDTLSAGQPFIIPEKPRIQSSVYDYAKILEAGDVKSLETKLLNYADTTSTQIVVITIPSLQGESIGELTPRWAQKWGIGQADKDNGVLILMSEGDREIWIAPGYGADERLTAGELGEMIRNVIIPEFKEGNHYAGLDKGTDAVMQMLAGKYKADAYVEDKRTLLEMLILEGLILFFCLIYHALGGFWAIAAAAATYSGSGKSSGSSSSGFRGGFGGGGFSGGGAGGKW